MKMASSCNYHRVLLFFVVLIAPMLVQSAKADTAKEKEECIQKLTGMATCLPYVGGQAKAPTPVCCTDLKQAINTNETCLCLVIKDRNDPDLGLKVNMTLAYRLPALCKETDAIFSQCPALLHLDPKSPEARAFFDQPDQNTNSQNMSPAPSPVGNEGSHPGGTSINGPNSTGEATANIGPAKSAATRNAMKWLDINVVGSGMVASFLALLWNLGFFFFFSSFAMPF